MSKPQMIGSINCYVQMSVTFKGRRIGYDGTTLGLVRQLLAHKGQAGDTFTDEQGRTRQIVTAKHDNRANGFWVTAWNLQH